MKKYLLFVLALCFALVTTAADLNPFAYGLSSKYDPSTFTLTINYSLNAPATSVELVIVDSNGKEAGQVSLPNRAKGTHTDIPVDLSTLGLVDGTYSWRMDVKCASRSSNYESVGRVINLQSPFSVDVDNNPNSPYFGRIYVTQPTTNAARGLYVYTPDWTIIGNYMGSGITVNTTQNWFTYIHAVPFRVRVVQDGTGRILTTSCDRDQSTHLWYVDPVTLTTWTPVVTSSQLNTWTGDNNSSSKFANINLDIRESDDKTNWEILLYSATVNATSKDFAAGYVYSGIYAVPKSNTNFTGGSYKPLTGATKNSSGTLTQHATISGEYTGSMLNANAQFDKFGGVLYASYSLGTNPDGSSLIHKTKSDDFKTSYTDGTYLYRQYVATGAIRFNHDFTRLAIAQGLSTQEALFYTVTQAQAGDHIALSNRQPVDMISSTINTDNKAYVLDFAWDYAQNVYAVVRTSPDYGVYAMAANLGGKPVSTPARAEYKFNVECPNRTWSVNVSGQVDDNQLNTALDGCALQINEESAAWNTPQSVQACSLIRVRVTKDNKHKFVGWYNGETLLTKEEEYSFYAVKDINLVAKFEFAEYNVKYYHLLADNNKVLGRDMNNADLWALFMAHFNDYNITYKNATENNIRSAQSIDAVLIFIDGTYAKNYIQDFMTNEKSQMKWLGDYMLSIATAQGKTINTATDWRANVCAFFKCESQPTNGNGVYDKYYGTSADFTDYGQPTHWHHYYTEHVSKLTPTVTYEDGVLAISIGELNPMITGHDRTPYPTWYNCNVDGKLLGWYYEGDNTKSIVHNAYQDGALFATWVDKHLDENDSKEDGASNEDVIKLMKNTKHATETDNVTVTRKLVGGMYNTICLPFRLDLTGLGNTHPLSGAKAYEFTGINPLYDTGSNEPVTVLNFTDANILLPGKPYLIVPKADVTEDMLFTGVSRTDLTLEPQSKTVTYGENELKITFHGVINPTEISAGALIVVADNRLAVNTEDNGTMKGMRGYFTIDFSSLAAQEVQEQALNGRVYLSFQKPVTTSVPLAPEAEQPTTPKVEKIMRDGQIYIIRDGVTYTITGARVR